MGPELVYARNEDELLIRALRLAREIEELLEDTRSRAGEIDRGGAHSTRIVRAVAASLVDELEALARGATNRDRIA
jgi:hypothetical protein